MCTQQNFLEQSICHCYKQVYQAQRISANKQMYLKRVVQISYNQHITAEVTARLRGWVDS